MYDRPMSARSVEPRCERGKHDAKSGGDAAEQRGREGRCASGLRPPAARPSPRTLGSKRHGGSGPMNDCGCVAYHTAYAAEPNVHKDAAWELEKLDNARARARATLITYRNQGAC